MGDAESIGFELNKVYTKKPEWNSLIIALTLTFIGLLAQYSIINFSPYESKNFINCLTFSFIGLGAGIFAYFFDYRKLQKYSKHIYIATSILLFLKIFILGRPIRSYIVLTIGYDILSPFFVILLYSISLCNIVSNLNFEDNKDILKLTVLFLIPLLLILKTNRSIFIVMFIVIFTLILIANKASLKSYVPVLLTCTFGFVFIMKSPYQMVRLLSFINSNNTNGSSYLNAQLKNIHNNSNFISYGADKELIRKLPNYDSDFIFSYIINYYGWFLALIIISLILLLAFSLYRSSKNIKNNYGKLLFLSLASVLLVEFAWSILMNLNLLPIVGISLPFISYGGSNFVINMTIIGLLSSIYSRKNFTKSYVTA